LRFERVDNLGTYRIPPETGILIPSGCDNYRFHLRVMQKKSRPNIGRRAFAALRFTSSTGSRRCFRTR